MLTEVIDLFIVYIDMQWTHNTFIRTLKDKENAMHLLTSILLKVATGEEYKPWSHNYFWTSVPCGTDPLICYHFLCARRNIDCFFAMTKKTKQLKCNTSQSTVQSWSSKWDKSLLTMLLCIISLKHATWKDSRDLLKSY